MPAKPLLIKKAPSKKVAPKKAAPAPKPKPAPAEPAPAEPAPAEAAPVPVEAAPAEAVPAPETAPPAEGDAAPAPPAEAAADAAVEEPAASAQPEAPADVAPAAVPAPTEPAATDIAPAEDKPVEAVAVPAPEEAAAPSVPDAEKTTDATPAPVEEQVAPAAPKAKEPADAAAAAEEPAAPAAPEAEKPADAAVGPGQEEPAAAPAPDAEPPADAAAAATPAAEETTPAAEPDAETHAHAAAASAAEEVTAPAAPEAPADAAAAAPAGEDAVAPAASEAPAEAPVAEAPAAEAPPAEAPPAEAPPAEEPKPPTPPPPAVPTSVPLNLTIEDVNDSSVTIKWRPPETIGDSGLDGYTVEYCKEQTTEWVVVNEKLTEANRMVIDNLTKGDILNIRVVAVNAGGCSPPAVLAEPVKVTEIVERPKIRLPRSLRSRIVKQRGEQVNLVIPFNGKPKPLVTWTKDGEPLDTKKINIRNSDRDSILFIRATERDQSGKYEISVKVESFEDKASIVLQVVDLPGPPSSMKLVDSWGFNAALEWTPPEDTGNTEITGYTVEKSDKKTGDWFTILEHYHQLSATISDLVMGNSYSFRVFAENKCGRSADATIAKGVATVPKTRIVYEPPEYQEFDFSEAPKFTAPLSDRAATVGYTTRLLCAVRGSPKPKIEWLKNQMIIGDDPKFRQLSNQGVCSLEIRKPCSFDGGIYTCRARNAHGEATVACKLEVKQVILPETDKGKK